MLMLPSTVAISALLHLIKSKQCGKREKLILLLLFFSVKLMNHTPIQIPYIPRGKHEPFKNT
jgi:hypothetical protein